MNLSIDDSDVNEDGREAIADVQATANALGHPPSRSEQADHGERHPNVLQRCLGTGHRWSAVLHAAGLRSRRDYALEAIAHTERDKHTWMSSAQIADEYAPKHVRAQDIGRVLAEIITEPEWGLTAEAWSDSQARWRVHLADEPDIVTDGGVTVVSAADESTPMQAVLRVSREGHSDDVDRVDVSDRAAVLSRTTRERHLRGFCSHAAQLPRKLEDEAY